MDPTPRQATVNYALTWLGRPYIWGGDDPAGIDCSGFVIECLKSSGKLPHSFDETADGLYVKYKPLAVFGGAMATFIPENIKPGCLIFWLAGSKAQHVELCINSWQCVGASGGGGPKYQLAEWLAVAQSAER